MRMPTADVFQASGQETRNPKEPWVIGGIITVAVVVFAVVLRDWGSYAAATKALSSVPWVWLSGVVGLAMLTFQVSVIGWRIYLAVRHRDVPTQPDLTLPTVTVLVPAFNEGKHVVTAVESLARSTYPPEKLRIIGVDDGSDDDTWVWLKRAASQFPDLVEVIRCPTNRGKRHALWEGLRRCDSDIVVTVDSDTVVEPDTIRRLVSPFVVDRRVGGVAGSIRVQNRDRGLIPAMLDASFAYNFDFIRASQSQVNSVLCCPGALSAYRRDVVDTFVDRWLNQTFMGRPANIGEDRALTNMVLAAGYHVSMQRRAIAWTQVPTSFSGLCRMYLRWARSGIRESLHMASFAFKRFRQTPMAGARINLVAQLLQMSVAQCLRVAAFAVLLSYPTMFGVQLIGCALIAGTLPAIVYALIERSSRCVWAYAYVLFAVLGLWWIVPWALLTPANNGWLTRRAGKSQPSSDVMAQLSVAHNPPLRLATNLTSPQSTGTTADRRHQLNIRAS